MSYEKPKGGAPHNDGCEWCGRFGLSREEIEALERLLDWHGPPDEINIQGVNPWLIESARAKLRAYLGGTE